jgi:replication factor C large subunit
MKMWVETYKPKNIGEMVGNEESRANFYQWLKNWKNNSKPVLLLGPPGTGKTTLTQVVAHELGYVVIELNASDVRTEEKMMKKLGPLLTSVGLLEQKMLVFLDEVDGLHDRKGLEFIERMIQNGNIPLVMAANVEDNKKVSKIEKKCTVLRFKRIPPRLVELYLRNLLKKIGKSTDDKIVNLTVKESKGDVRAAVNTIQTFQKLSKEDLKNISAKRDLDFSLKEGINLFFSSETGLQAFQALNSLDVEPRLKIRSIFYSIIDSNLQPDVLVAALDAVSEADVLLGRIRKTQRWRLLRYYNRMLAYSLIGVVPKGVVKYSKGDLPWNLKLRIWNESKIFSEFSKKFSFFIHSSRKETSAIFLPYLLLILNQDKKRLENLVRLLGFDERTLKVLSKDSDRITMKVKS